jgi:formamidopyrimidine-DNA glycosylase
MLVAGYVILKQHPLIVVALICSSWDENFFFGS